MRVSHLPLNPPPWAQHVIDAGWPVVVRRAPASLEAIPVGIRGQTRAQRLAAWLPLAAVTARVTPEDLIFHHPQRALSQWQALAHLRPLLDASGLQWGIIGAAGFELATGIDMLHAHSDLDLLIRTPLPFSRESARQLWAQCQQVVCRIDLQLQTPAGGVALAEWASSATTVLVKGEQAPCLLENPWAD